jgi:hypothetical protein
MGVADMRVGGMGQRWAWGGLGGAHPPPDGFATLGSSSG